MIYEIEVDGVAFVAEGVDRDDYAWILENDERGVLGDGLGCIITIVGEAMLEADDKGVELGQLRESVSRRLLVRANLGFFFFAKRSRLTVQYMHFLHFRLPIAISLSVYLQCDYIWFRRSLHSLHAL